MRKITREKLSRLERHAHEEHTRLKTYLDAGKIIPRLDSVVDLYKSIEILTLLMQND